MNSDMFQKTEQIKQLIEFYLVISRIKKLLLTPTNIMVKQYFKKIQQYQTTVF